MIPRARVLIAFVVTFLGWASPAASQSRFGSPDLDQSPNSSATQSGLLRRPQFIPFETSSSSDWIELKSGEWLKGEILNLRDGMLEFDSEELDELKLDLDDIVYIHSPRRHVVQIEGREDLRGQLEVVDGVVVVSGPEGGQVDRALLMSSVPTDGSWRSHWSGRLSFGLSARSGNSSQTDLNSYLFIRRQTSSSRWDTSFNGAFSEVDGKETADNSRLSSDLDYFLTRRLFVTPLGISAYRDPFSNISMRVIPSAGVGYDLVDANTLTWEISGGPAYTYTRYDSVPVGDSKSEDSVAVLAGTSMEWDVTPDVELNFGYEITLPVSELDDYTSHLSATLAIDLIDWIDTDLSLVWDRVNSPSADEEGKVPDPNDFRITFGVGIDF